MSEHEFDRAFAHVVGLEGGYVNDPRDAGGETKFGISKRSYPNENIKALTIERAKVIYQRDYWYRLKCSQLPYPLNVFIFDAGVNQGCGTAAILLQKLIGETQDGILGPRTVAALNAYMIRHPINLVCADYMAARALRYTATPSSEHYLKGWLNRLFRLTFSL
jgi:lysozyme family protein